MAHSMSILIHYECMHSRPLPIIEKTAKVRLISLGLNGDEDSQALAYCVRKENYQASSIHPSLLWIHDLRVCLYNNDVTHDQLPNPRGKYHPARSIQQKLVLRLRCIPRAPTQGSRPVIRPGRAHYPCTVDHRQDLSPNKADMVGVEAQ